MCRASKSDETVSLHAHAAALLYPPGGRSWSTGRLPPSASACVANLVSRFVSWSVTAGRQPRVSWRCGGSLSLGYMDACDHGNKGKPQPTNHGNPTLPTCRRKHGGCGSAVAAAVLFYYYSIAAAVLVFCKAFFLGYMVYMGICIALQVFLRLVVDVSS